MRRAPASPRLLLVALLTALASAAAAQTPLHALSSPGEVSFGFFGWAVSGVPDVDGDGRGDLLVGAENEGSGRAYVFSGVTGALLHTLTSPDLTANGAFGYAVAGVEDVDGDGRGDLLVGARDEGSSLSRAGRAYVFSGASGALLHTLVSPNEEAFGSFGFSVAGVPDADGDGRGDLLVGAPGEDSVVGITNAGRAYVFSGATGALLHTLASPSPEATGDFGNAVAGVPDLDGDGRGDLLVGAWRETPGVGGERTGRAYVFSGADGGLLYALASPHAEAFGAFGWSVAGVPDADGDGRGDLLVGAYTEDVGVAPDAGRAYVFSGGDGALLRVLTSPDAETNGWFGVSVSGVPDADGDGRGDLLVGARREDVGAIPDAGRAHAFSGASGVLLHTLASSAGEDGGHFGNAVAGVPDLDGDGRGDLLVGAFQEDPGASPTDAGRAYVFGGAGGPPPVLSIAASALNSPVPHGGRLRFRVTLTNLTPVPLSGDLVLAVAAPDGSTHVRTLTPDGTLPEGATRTPTYGLPVRSDAPPGLYTATVSALVGGTVHVGEAAFTFEVVAVTARSARMRGGVGGASPVGLGGVFGSVEVLDSDGFDSGPPVADASAALPAGFSLSEVYPNPSAGQARLTLVVTEASRQGGIRVEVLDGLGRRVAVLHDGALAAGTHALAWNAEAAPPGAYVVRVAAGTFSATRRVVLVR